jgi:hypothetical protein
MPASSRIRGLVAPACVLSIAVLASVSARSATPRFFPDDPLTREPETQDASTAQPHELILLYEITENLFSKPGDPAADVRARNVNTIDEVPDSSWFTNRAGSRSLTAAEIERGPNQTAGPAAGTWTVTAAKIDGVTPGFTVRDSAGEVWFLKFDPPGFSSMATGAEVVSTKLLWALGYHVPENHIAKLDPTTLAIDPKATVEPRGFPKRPIKEADIRSMLRHADRDANGTYRVIASRRLPGRPLGGFRFYGTRPGDPNDIIPHEHRRELRGYLVAAAWLNHVDAKSINSLDVLITDDGRAHVRHYLLDFGSTLGSAALAPRNYPEGSEYMVEPGKIGKRAVTLGLAIEPWRTVALHESPAVGRLPADPSSFDPEAWRPTVPNPAMIRARADDKFWMARKIMAITDEQLRAAVTSGVYSRQEDIDFLVKTLAGRRDAIGRAYLPAVNPIVSPALDEAGQLTFANAAVDAGIAAAPKGYTARWSRLDNNDPSRDRELGKTEGGASMKAPQALPRDANALVRIEVAAVDPQVQAWAQPVSIVFRRTAGAWQLVGLGR